jgi:hypothetical protein
MLNIRNDRQMVPLMMIVDPRAIRCRIDVNLLIVRPWLKYLPQGSYASFTFAYTFAILMLFVFSLPRLIPRIWWAGVDIYH